jgi:hypothetical protein
MLLQQEQAAILDSLRSELAGRGLEQEQIEAELSKGLRQ